MLAKINILLSCSQMLKKTIWYAFRCIFPNYSSLNLYWNLFAFIDNGQTKPKPRDSKKTPKAQSEHDHGENRCLFRATSGSKKISTVVRCSTTFTVFITVTIMISNRWNMTKRILWAYLKMASHRCAVFKPDKIEHEYFYYF